MHLSGRGGRLGSDGQSVVLPAALESSDSSRSPYIVVQSARVGSGSLQPVIMRQLIGRPGAIEGFVYLEVHRTTALLSARIPSAFFKLPEIQWAVDLMPVSAGDFPRVAMSAYPLPGEPALQAIPRSRV